MYELVNFSNINGCSSYFRIVFRRDNSRNNTLSNDVYILKKGVSNDYEKERISLSRTKRNIKEIALCNDFEYFSTLTIDSTQCDRFSLSACQEKLKKILKAMKRKNKNFAYIWITEKHKNGAFHFHGLLKGIDDFYINKNGYLSHKMFDELGFNSHSKIHDYNKTCNYIMKYITKDCVRNEANQIYISSRGLKKATREEIMPVDLTKFVTFNHPLYSNDFVECVEFSADDLSEDQKLEFTNLIKNRKNFRNNIDINYIIR